MSDYPPLPTPGAVPPSLIGLWARAQAHVWIIDVYAAGLMSYVDRPQLTTGEPQPAVEPCTCTYHLDVLRMPTYGHRVVRDLETVTGSRFRIAWFCPHHGRGSE